MVDLREADPGSDRPVTDSESEVDAGRERKRPKIRCPLCMWVPKASDRWTCYCGCEWNTFDTGGRCPECSFQYHQTMCLNCHKWSKHIAWYTDGERE